MLKCVGGEVGPASTLAPKIGPLGLSPKKVGDDIKEATKEWRGIKVMVQLVIQNRQATVLLVPYAPALVIKALGEAPRDRKKTKNIKHSGNITWEQVRTIADTMKTKSCAKEFIGVLKEIVGTCSSVGCTIEKKAPKEIFGMINSGELNITEP